MSRTIPNKTKRLIKKLYAKNLSVAKIAKRAGVSYQTAYGYTRLRQRINPETGQLYESLSQYQKYMARQRINPETRQPFESLSKYQYYRIRQKINPETGQPYESPVQYQDCLARQIINPETGQPYESLNQAQKYQARQRQNRPENQELSDLILSGLERIGKNQSWLAKEISVTKQAVSLYIKAKAVPRNDLLRKLFSALERKKSY